MKTGKGVKEIGKKMKVKGKVKGKKNAKINAGEEINAKKSARSLNVDLLREMEI